MAESDFEQPGIFLQVEVISYGRYKDDIELNTSTSKFDLMQVISPLWRKAAERT